jgi:MoaA/NifB/PqqE/SkfB family radical SAM enzyme
MFEPTEIIFASTNSCNLKCPHCFVNPGNKRLEIQDAVNFLNSCKNSAIEKVGFSGGEPFLYQEFLTEVIRAAVKNDLMFDRIMTNGEWWTKAPLLHEALQKVYDAGYDGKIGLSWDAFHGQSFSRICVFIQEVMEVFGGDCLEIQTVLDSIENQAECPTDELMIFNFQKLAEHFNLEFEYELDKKSGRGWATLQGQVELSSGPCDVFIPVNLERPTLQFNQEEAWKSKKWFKDDYCEGPGQILFIHPGGDIAPCCGFANEEKELFIGSIKDSFDEVIKKASENALVNLCYNEGLSTAVKVLKENGAELPFGPESKTDNPCTFCQFVCKNAGKLN